MDKFDPKIWAEASDQLTRGANQFRDAVLGKMLPAMKRLRKNLEAMRDKWDSEATR